MPDFESGPVDLPWSTPAWLLFNGVNVEHLARTLYSCKSGIDPQPVFLLTRFKDLLDKSPMLVAIEGRFDPLYELFLKHVWHDWGLLLFSESPMQDILAHLRWLLFVDEPGRKPTYLNLSDPIVANALYGLPPQHTDDRLFGPIEQVHAADVIHACWRRHVRQGPPPPAQKQPLYGLNPMQLQALGESNLNIMVIELEKHMRQFFTDYLPYASLPERYQHLHGLASQAYAQGFTTEMDIFHYANVSHFLSTQPTDAHADIRQLLTTTSPLTHSQRVQQANWLAVERSHAGASS